jgi:hypothetical protein
MSKIAFFAFVHPVCCLDSKDDGLVGKYCLCETLFEMPYKSDDSKANEAGGYGESDSNFKRMYVDYARAS